MIILSKYYSKLFADNIFHFNKIGQLIAISTLSCVPFVDLLIKILRGYLFSSTNLANDNRHS